MPDFPTSAARAGLDILVEAELAGQATIHNFERLEAGIPSCQGMVFELVLGQGHAAEADLTVRVEPETVPDALQALGSPSIIEDYRRLTLPGGVDRAWIEMDTLEDPALPSVFATYNRGLDRSTTLGVVRELGGDSSSVPPWSSRRVRHIGVVQGRGKREIRLILTEGDPRSLLEAWGLGAPALGGLAALGPLKLSFGLGPQLLPRFGVEVDTWGIDPARFEIVPMTHTQRSALIAWSSLYAEQPRPGGRRAGINHVKWLEPKRETKVYLAVL